MGIGKVWVYAEADGEDPDKPHTSTLELLTKAREIGDTVEAVYIGSNADTLAGALGEHGATKVHAVERGDALSGVVGAAVLARLVESEQPDLVLFAQTYDGRDAVGRLSAKLDRPVLTNGTAMTVEGDTVKVQSSIFGGTTLVDTEFKSDKPWLAAIRPKSFAAEPGGGSAAEVVKVDGVDTGRAGEAKVLEADAGSGAPRRTSRSWSSWPRCSAARRGHPAPSSMPVGCRMRSRSVRRARPSSRSCTSRSGSPARRSTSSA